MNTKKHSLYADGAGVLLVFVFAGIIGVVVGLIQDANLLTILVGVLMGWGIAIACLLVFALFARSRL